jgi:acetate kinase
LRVLVANAGSSSLKLRLLGSADELIAKRDLDMGGELDGDAVAAALAAIGDADAVGHRIVHGGPRFRSAVRLDDSVVAELRGLTELAPLHQPKSLAALDAVSRSRPDVPAVACFDTAFHALIPAAAATYALPAAWRERWPLRRYGFHGLSHSYVARRAPELLGEEGEHLRIVSCHLGAGASLCAIRGGRSLDTTMGFTPLEGLVMATRSGSVDPGLLVWLLEPGRLEAPGLSRALEHESGLLALGGSADMREILERASQDDAAAQLAVEVYLHRLRAGIAAMSAALGGLDVLVFTGGVGENAPAIRRDAVAGLGYLGVALDERGNEATTGDADISANGSQVRTLVISAREDLEIAGEVRAVLRGERGWGYAAHGRGTPG